MHRHRLLNYFTENLVRARSTRNYKTLPYKTYLFYFALRYLQLLSIVPDDVGVLQKLGDIYENINDKQQAYHYYYEVSNIYFQRLYLLLYVMTLSFRFVSVLSSLSFKPRSVGLVRSILCRNESTGKRSRLL